MTRLHIDFDSNRDSNSPGREPGSPSAAEAEAKRFQAAFVAVTRDGISEQGLRTLLDEAKAFLSAQPRDQVRTSDVVKEHF